MIDTISRQAAIDALGEKPLVWDDLSDFDLGKAAQWSDDVDAIKALPSAQPKHTETHECVYQRTETHACDSISRQDTVDVIASMIAYHKTLDDAYWYVKSDAPSAQPEIIRCRDCKHYRYADNRIPQEQMCVCDLDGDRWSPDSYCSFAERKEK